MGRDMGRQSAFFDAAGRRVELYRMTEGQQVALAAANQRDIGQVMTRLWQVLESLFVIPDDFERFDHALVIGKITKEQVERFASDVMRYKWPDPELEPQITTGAPSFTTIGSQQPEVTPETEVRTTTDAFGRPLAADNEPY